MARKRKRGKGKNGWNSILSAYKYRARSKGYLWLLTDQEFNELIRAPCHYCHADPKLVKTGNVVTVDGIKFHYSGVDRVNNRPIYSNKEVVPCCWKCNRCKNELTKKEFINHVKKIAANAK